MDEARVGQQGTLTRVWAPRGTRPRALRDHRRNSAYLFGAVCPERGIGAAVALPHGNVEAMTIHLAEMPGTIYRVDLENCLGRIKADHGNAHCGRLPFCRFSTTRTLAHRCRWGPSTPCGQEPTEHAPGPMIASQSHRTFA